MMCTVHVRLYCFINEQTKGGSNGNLGNALDLPLVLQIDQNSLRAISTFAKYLINALPNLVCGAYLFKIQNRLMQQPLCHFYFITVLEHLKDKPYQLLRLNSLITKVNEV